MTAEDVGLDAGWWEVGGFDANPTRFFNRELSWLAFNARVLTPADDERVPLLERVKFLAIFASNLDEFFQVRVAGLSDQVAGDIAAETPDGRTPRQQLHEIRPVVEATAAQAQHLWEQALKPSLAETGIGIADWSELGVADQRYLTEVFDTRIFPTLTPLAVDPGHPFPYISGLSLNLAVVAVDRHDGRRLFARVKVPPSLPRFLAIPDVGRWVPVEQVIAAHLPSLFPGFDIGEHHVFRVTRNADLTVKEGEADDLLAAVETELRRRRFGRAVRLEVASTMSREVRELLMRELDVDADEVYESESLVDLAGLFDLASLPRPDLHERVFSGVTEPELIDEDERGIFALLRERDVFLHHPYSSFTTSVVEFIRQAAVDPHVLAIKITIYRTSGDSPVIDALIDAAEHGKQVAVLLELKARFDEKANIEWARRLEQAGVHVAYGIVGYKIHTKVCMVIRDDPDGIRRYVHIGTGNYNPRTARLYEDFGVLTADRQVGADVTNLFNVLTGYGRGIHYDTLLVAPETMRSGLRDLIDDEIRAGSGRIVMKMNSLIDPELIDRLYLASSAGVSIDLIVRGICGLRPGVPGLSENIRVRSIVGRYLEHSRLYCFGHGGDPVYLMGSADLMPRNLDRRVEVLVSVRDAASRARLDEVIEVCLADDHLSWHLDGDGRWRRRREGKRLDAQQRLQELALVRAGAVG
jgi:polyphosphate kinase